MNMFFKGLQKRPFSILAAILLFVGFSFGQGGWNTIKRGGAEDLVTVYFISSDKGFVGGDGGYLARTNDGGRSWTRQTLSGNDDINEIYFRNDDNGYILAGRKIYLTKDGGKTWRENVVGSKSDYKNLTPDFLSVRFTDKKEAGSSARFIIGAMKWLTVSFYRRLTAAKPGIA